MNLAINEFGNGLKRRLLRIYSLIVHVLSALLVFCHFKGKAQLISNMQKV